MPGPVGRPADTVRPEVSECSRMPASRRPAASATSPCRSEEHTSELQSRQYLVCRLLLEKKKIHRCPSVPADVRHGAGAVRLIGLPCIGVEVYRVGDGSAEPGGKTEFVQRTRDCVAGHLV